MSINQQKKPSHIKENMDKRLRQAIYGKILAKRQIHEKKKMQRPHKYSKSHLEL